MFDSLRAMHWKISFMMSRKARSTHYFHNVRVIEEYKPLEATLQDRTLSESEDFAEPAAQPLELPDSFTTTEAMIEIKGLPAFGRYL